MLGLPGCSIIPFFSYNKQRWPNKERNRTRKKFWSKPCLYTKAVHKGSSQRQFAKAVARLARGCHLGQRGDGNCVEFCQSQGRTRLDPKERSDTAVVLCRGLLRRRWAWAFYREGPALPWHFEITRFRKCPRVLPSRMYRCRLPTFRR